MISSQPRVKRKHFIYLGLGVCHLALLSLGALHITSFKNRVVDSAFGVMGLISGVDNHYSFFAPSIGTEIRVRYECYLSTSSTEKICAGNLIKANRETELRIGNIVNIFWAEGIATPEKRAILASWAGTIFGRNPKATKVKLLVEIFSLPSMTQFRLGQKTGWKEYYEADFER